MLDRITINQDFKPENPHAARHEGVIVNSICSQAFSFEGINMGKFKRMDAPLCACRCGQSVKWNKWEKRWNKYIRGHNARGENHPNYGKDKYIKEKMKTPPLCACGCGKPVRWDKQRGRWNKFINRHNPHPMLGKDKYKEKKIKSAPLCACGCGEPTKWCETRKRWNKFINEHHTRGENHHFYGKKRPELSGKKHPFYDRKRPNTSKRMLGGQAGYMLSFIKNPSKPQVELFELVKQLYPNAVLNYPSLNKSIDIALPDQMIAIEYDGSYWHQDEEADEKRQGKLEAIGWEFIRYRDHVPSIEGLKRDLRAVL